MLYISLINNITLLITLSMVHTLLMKFLPRGSARYQLLSGILFGIVAIAGMINSVKIEPGLIFDGRSIILVTAGIFGGPVTAAVAIIVSGTYRLLLGGPGALMGVLVILESGLFGILLYHLRKRYKRARRPVSFLLVGMLVHLVMIGLLFILPNGLGKVIMPQIILPVLLIYPVATFLVCLLFNEAEQSFIINKRLTESEEKFRMLAENANDLIYRYEFIPVPGFSYVSPSAKRITGYTPEDHYADAQLGYKMVHPDDRHLLEAVNKGDKEIRKPVTLRWVKANGEIIWTEQKNTPIYNEHRQLVAIEGIARDVTHRKRTEMVQKVLYNISNAVVVTQNVEEYIGVIRQELATLIDTSNFYIAFLNEKTGMLSAPYSKDFMDRIQEWPMERSLTGLVIRENKSLLVTRKDVYELYERGEVDLIGTVSECWLGVPMRENGKVTGAFVVQSYENANAYSEKDAEILEFVSTQVSLSIQRQRSIEELRLALMKAEESDQLKTAFLNNLSHEVRTPLNAIVGFSGLLNKPKLTEETRTHFTDIIQKSSDQLLYIIDSIFDIATIEAGQVKLFERESNLNKVLGIVQGQFMLKVASEDLKLEFVPGLRDEDANVITDETKLFQVFNNLVGNAIKFTEKGKIEFGYSVFGENLHFYVSDTGIGIPADKHEIIFEKFRQADLSTSRIYGGTGLGLYISKSYIEKMGGTIHLESEPGKGSTFSFTLPLVRSASKLKPEISIKKPEKPINKTILIAEDDELNFILASEMLSGLGLNIIHARDGAEAVHICRAMPEIELVLMDIKMPNMDGYEATRIIREFKPALPLIALTAFAMVGDRELILEKGFTDYIPKPVNLATLIKVVSSYLLKDAG
jgi:PAS domain S-box-containing protein